MEAPLWCGAQRALLGCVAVTVMLGCGSQASPQLAVRESIYGGEIVAACSWPNVVSLGGVCTGAFVSPHMLVYAAHCGSNFDQVHVDGRTIELARCDVFGDYGFGSATDVAFCVPRSPVDTFLPIAQGCERDGVMVGTPVTLVGFGEDGTSSAVGTKRAAIGEVLEMGVELTIGSPNPEGGPAPCPGDSGGPAIIEGPDGYRLLGISSSRLATTCDGSSGFYVDLAPWVPWLEETAGSDISPCFGADGEWEPNAGCVRSALGAGAASADGHCPGSDVQGPGEACGLPFNPPPKERGCSVGNGRIRSISSRSVASTPLAWVLVALLMQLRRVKLSRGHAL
jgi:hypothetical protein